MILFTSYGSCRTQTDRELYKTHELYLYRQTRVYLTIPGKTNVLNSIALSRLWYLGTALRMLPEEVDIIEKKIQGFLWNGKRSRVNKLTCQCPKKRDDLKLKITVLKLQWFTK